MDFQEALAKYKNKTASQQEIQFVEQTVNEARKTAKIRKEFLVRHTPGARVAATVGSWVRATRNDGSCE